MKKGICCLLAALSAIGLYACGGGNGGNGGGASEAKIELTYGEKYIYREDVRAPQAEQEYFIFYENGTAEYHYYYKYENKNNPEYNELQDYTMDLIYTEMAEENTIFCFYNGVEYDEEDTEKTAKTDTIYTIICSENIVMTSNGSKYILESYLDEVPLFGK